MENQGQDDEFSILFQNLKLSLFLFESERASQALTGEKQRKNYQTPVSVILGLSDHA